MERPFSPMGAPPVISRKREMEIATMKRSLAHVALGLCLGFGALSLAPAQAQTGAIAVTHACLLDYAEQIGHAKLAKDLRLIPDLDPEDDFLVHPDSGWVINAVCPPPQPLRSAERPSRRWIVSATFVG